MKHNQDWSATDFESLKADALPVTAYKPMGDPVSYSKKYTQWGDGIEGGVTRPAFEFYRMAWRYMAANTGERTFIPAIIPPHSAHTDGIHSAGAPDLPSDHLVAVTGVASALLSDFAVRAAPKSTIRPNTINRLPMPELEHPLMAEVRLRTLQLNCVTSAYSELWKLCWDDAFVEDVPILPRYAAGSLGPEWTDDTPLRRGADRRNAQVEIDALVALMFGVDIEDLCTVYRTQFAVLYGYDHNEYTYDANGRLVPNSVLTVWRKKGDKITQEERTAKHPGSGVDYEYELPFGTLNREADMRTAYAEFERRLAEKPAGTA